MALSRTIFTADAHHAASTGSSYTTASKTLPASALIIVLAYGCAYNNPNVRPSSFTLANSAGLAMTVVGDTGTPATWGYGTRVWYLETTTSVSSTFTVQCASEVMGAWDVQVLAYTGYDTSARVAGFIAGKDADGTGANSVTLGATPTTSDEVLGGIAGTCTTGGTYTVGEGTGFTRIFLATDTTTECYSEAQYRDSSTSTSVAWTSVGASGVNQEAMMFGLIIKAASGGGSTYNVTAAESGTAADSPSSVKTAPGTIAEAGAGIDALLAVGGNGVIQLETGAATDSPTVSASMGVTITSTGAAVDSPSATASIHAAIAEVLSGSDTVAVGLPLTITVLQHWYQPVSVGNSGMALTAGSNPMTVTAGTTLLAVWTGSDNQSMPPPTDSAGTFTVPTGGIISANGANSIWLGCALQTNATGGSHTITPPAVHVGGNGELGIWIYEITNMPATANIRDLSSQSIVQTNQSWTLTTTNAASVGDIAVAWSTYENIEDYDPSDLSDPPSGGWTSLGYAEQHGTVFIPTTVAYQVVESAGTLTATWATTDPTVNEHLAMILTLVPNASSGSTYSATSAESGTASDAPAAHAVDAAVVAEAGAAVDTSSGALVASRAVSEIGTAADAIDRTASSTQASIEAATASDTPGVIVTTAAVVVEADVAVDTPSSTMSTTTVVSEAATAAEVAAGTTITTQAVAEIGSAIDTPDSGGVTSAAVAEAGAAADVNAAAAALLAVTAEAGTAADSASAATMDAAAVTESGTAADESTTGNGFTTGVITEAGAATDTGSAAALLVGIAAEAGNLVDLITGAAALGVTISDVGAAADTVAQGSSSTQVVVENGAAVDTFDGLRIVNGAVADVLVSVDALGISTQFVATAAEMGIVLDASTASAILGLALVEAAAAIETANAASGQGASVADMLNAVDSTQWLHIAFSLLRSFAFSAESRNYTFPAESRSLAFPAESRSFPFPPESRSHAFQETPE